MARDDYRDGWGVVGKDGLIVNTVADTKRAAMVNWLCTSGHHLARQATTDLQIQALFDAFSAEDGVMAQPVRIYVQ